MTSRSGLSASCLALALAAGCKADPCVDGLDEGRRVRLSLIEAYDDRSSSGVRFDPALVQAGGLPCGMAFGIGPGTKLVLKAEEIDTEMPGGCGMWRARPEPFGGTEIDGLGPAPMPKRDSLAYFAFQARASGCAGTLQVMIRVPDRGDPFRAITPSELPPALVMRSVSNITASAAGCPMATCTDYWVGTLERL